MSMAGGRGGGGWGDNKEAGGLEGKKIRLLQRIGGEVEKVGPQRRREGGLEGKWRRSALREEGKVDWRGSGGGRPLGRKGRRMGGKVEEVDP